MPDPLTATGSEFGSTLGSAQSMADLAAGIEKKEQARYDRGVGIATPAFTESRDTLSKGLDADLLFSRAADAVGARGRQNMNALRTSLGARGISASSGAAGGVLQRLMMSQEGQLIGAQRDIGIANQQQRYVNAGRNFANAMNLAGLINSPVSGAVLETSQNIFEGNIAREGIQAQARSTSKSNKSNLLGALIGGGSSILAGLI